MEGLAPVHVALIELIHGLESGKSTYFSIHKYCSEHNSEFSQKLGKLISNQHNQEVVTSIINNESKIFRKQLYFLISKSLNGVPVLTFLKELEQDLSEHCEAEMEEFVSALPFKMLIPVFLFQFPALLLLILYPFFQYLGEGLR